MLINNCCQDIQEHCPHCSRKLCNTINREKVFLAEKNTFTSSGIFLKEESSMVEQNTFAYSLSDYETLNCVDTAERFVFSFYVKIDRDISEEENLDLVKSQLESLEEIENLSSLYFKRYFNRLLFNEIVIDFVSLDTELWKKEPKSILRKIPCYNDAYKFSQLNLETLQKH